MCVHLDLIFQEDFLSPGEFSSMCQGPLFQLYKQSWFTHKRLDLEEIELSMGQGECLRGMGVMCEGQCYPGCFYLCISEGRGSFLTAFFK